VVKNQSKEQEPNVKEAKRHSKKRVKKKAKKNRQYGTVEKRKQTNNPF
jgi:hypothetical protein